MRIGMRSKAERGRALAMGERPQAMRAEAVEIPRDASVEEAYALILRHCLTHLLSNEAAAFEGASSEGLHQMRVALRRLRSAFIAFGALTHSDAAADMAREAKWLTRAIGHARDSDVFLSEIIAPVVADDPDDKGLVALSAAAEKAQGDAWASAREAVRSPRMTRFVLRLALYLDERGWRAGKDADLEALKAPVSAFASAALDKRLKKVTKLARDIDHLETDERHELRKRLKKLRYTLSFFSALFPRAETKSYLHRLTRLQDVFGALNDLETAHGIVNELGRAHPRLAAPGARLLGFHEKRARKEWQSALKMWRNFRDQPAFWR
jgi:CHAD domain-containing protein